MACGSTQQNSPTPSQTTGTNTSDPEAPRAATTFRSTPR